MSAREHAEAVPCSYCGAEAGERCRTKSGARATYPHGARLEPIYAAWRDGFYEGQADVIGALDSDSEWGRRYVAHVRAQIERQP